jgi:hypothetical protein
VVYNVQILSLSRQISWLKASIRGAAAARGTYVKSAGLKRPSGVQKRWKLDFWRNRRFPPSFLISTIWSIIISSPPPPPSPLTLFRVFFLVLMNNQFQNISGCCFIKNLYERRSCLIILHFTDFHYCHADFRLRPAGICPLILPV